MKLYKIALEMITSFVLSVSVFNIDAYAQDINNGSLYISTSGNYEVTGKLEETENNIVISGGKVNLTLNNLDLSCDWYIAPIHVTGGADVNLILVGDNSIRGDYGIIVDYGSKLSISGDGNLYVKADSSAGIGGQLWSSYGVGDIVINSGKITAISNSGAGIGSGYGNCETAGTGNIVINGGSVTGISNNDSAGIGSGAFNDIGGICISGNSRVYGESLRGGAGIGYGANVRRSNVAYSEFVEDLETDTLKENKVYKTRADLNYLGDIVINDKAKVESYSYTGSGVGLGARNEGEAAFEVGIHIEDSANVEAVSYKGEAIGNGAYLDWESSESLLASAPDYVKSNIAGENVFAASSRIRHRSEDSSANIMLDGNAKIKAGSLLNKALDASKVTSNIGVLNLNIDNELEDEEDIEIVDTDDMHKINVSSKYKGYASTIKDGEYNSITENNETKVMSGDTNGTIVVSGVTNKNIKVTENTELYNTLYVSEFGSNDNSGLSCYEPIKDFIEAYRRVNEFGTIVVCGGNIRIYSLPSMNKHITVTSDDGICNYSNYGCFITLGSNLESLKDSLLIINSKVRTHRDLDNSSVKIMDCIVKDNKIDTIKLRGYKKANSIGIEKVTKPFLQY